MGEEREETGGERLATGETAALSVERSE